jgi:hypothetical protein
MHLTGKLLHLLFRRMPKRRQASTTNTIYNALYWIIQWNKETIIYQCHDIKAKSYIRSYLSSGDNTLKSRGGKPVISQVSHITIILKQSHHKNVQVERKTGIPWFYLVDYTTWYDGSVYSPAALAARGQLLNRHTKTFKQNYAGTTRLHDTYKQSRNRVR